MDTPAVVTIEATALADTQVDFVILTAVQVERDAVLAMMEPCQPNDAIARVARDESTYFVGRIGLYCCALVLGEAGDAGSAGSGQTAAAAIDHWAPSAVVMVGIAFGAKKKTQVIGDVLVATQIFSYENKKVTKSGIEERGPMPAASTLLLDRARSLLWTWTFQTKDGTDAERPPHFGPMLSGPTLVNDRVFLNSLKARFPTAIGGEMEGAGLYGAANRKGVHWFIVKAICDWGFKKTDGGQRLAARNAALFLVALLTEPSLTRLDFRRGQSQQSGTTQSSALAVAMQNLELDRIRGNIRSAISEEKRAGDSLSLFLENSVGHDSDGTPFLPKEKGAMLQIRSTANLAAIEATLTAYEDGAIAVAEGRVDRIQFCDSFGVEILQLFSIEGEHKRLLALDAAQADPFPFLRELHSGLLAERGRNGNRVPSEKK